MCIRDRRGILRGLHYQTQQVQGKLVRVVAGEVFDVAVDMRRDSPTLGHWAGALLSADNHRMMWIPPGFAHGFYVTTESAEFVYKCTDFYAPEHEVSMRWDDPAIGIDASKINRELGYVPAESFETGIRKTLHWFLANEPWWRAILDGSYRN